MRSLRACLVLACSACVPPPVAAPEAPADAALEVPEATPVAVARINEGAPRPVVRQHNYRIEAGQLGFEVEPDAGARVVEFSWAGQNLLLGRGQSPGAYGSTFWTSPERDWRGRPPPELDQGVWRATADGDELMLASAVMATSELSATQRILVEAARGALHFEYQLTNQGKNAKKVAPLQVTRVPGGGLTFYPAQGNALAESTLKVEVAQGVSWYQHYPELSQRSDKLLGGGQEGWLAHVQGRTLLLKLFPDVSPSEVAPGEGEIGLYVHEDGSYMELAQQGAYVELAPGASLRWPVTWVLRSLPEGVPASSGEPVLLKWVRAVVEELDRGEKRALRPRPPGE